MGEAKNSFICLIKLTKPSDLQDQKKGPPSIHPTRIILIIMAEQRSVIGVVKRFLEDYASVTPTKLKLIDAYMGYILITGVIQFLYCCLVGTFPFNSFLSGFISCVGSFILAACLRIQSNPQNKADFRNIGPERAFADFLFASIVLHLVVVNFVG